MYCPEYVSWITTRQELPTAAQIFLAQIAESRWAHWVIATLLTEYCCIEYVCWWTPMLELLSSVNHHRNILSIICLGWYVGWQTANAQGVKIADCIKHQIPQCQLLFFCCWKVHLSSLIRISFWIQQVLLPHTLWLALKMEWWLYNFSWLNIPA